MCLLPIPFSWGRLLADLLLWRHHTLIHPKATTSLWAVGKNPCSRIPELLLRFQWTWDPSPTEISALQNTSLLPSFTLFPLPGLFCWGSLLAGLLQWRYDILTHPRGSAALLTFEDSLNSRAEEDLLHSEQLMIHCSQSSWGSAALSSCTTSWLVHWRPNSLMASREIYYIKGNRWAASLSL